MSDGDFVGGIALGSLAGLVAGTVGLVALASAMGPNVDKVKVFKEENKPAVMRLYSPQADKLFVESPEFKEEYRPFYDHLQTIEDEADRELEEARIKKQVEWYK